MGYTPEQLRNVQKQAFLLSMGVNKLVGDDPTLMVACLTMAASYAATLSDVSYEEMKTLFEMHYKTAAADLAAMDAAEKTGLGVPVGKTPEGKQ